MKIAILDTYYERFLERFYASGRPVSDYASGLRALLDAKFGTADFYSRHLTALGADAQDYVLNDRRLQFEWAESRGLKPPAKILSRALSRWAPRFGEKSFLERCALAQIKEARPDVAYVQDCGWLSPSALREIKSTGAMLVGQIACPMPIAEKMREFDLIVTSFPHYVTRIRGGGGRAEYLKLAFEPSVLDAVGERKRIYEAVFVGGLGGHHRAGVHALELAARSAPMDVWGYGAEELPSKSPLRKRFHGEAWALDMFSVLGSAKIAINRHIDVSENFANNMRLYEATGMGAMLLTDAKDNLSEFFVPGKEIAVYRSPAELAEMLSHYSSCPQEAQAIAEAGQRRTLNEHTYLHRMVELKAILERSLRRPRRKASPAAGFSQASGSRL